MVRRGLGTDRMPRRGRSRALVPVLAVLLMVLSSVDAAPAAAQGAAPPSGATAALAVSVASRAPSGTTYSVAASVTQAAACAGCPAVPVPGVEVAFQSSAGVLSSAAALTDSRGIASVELTLLPGATATVTVTIPGLSALVAQVPGQAAAAAPPPSGTTTPSGTTASVPATSQSPPSSSARSSTPASFTDITSVSWAIPSIILLASQGVVQGVGGSAFAPQSPVTEEQAVSFLARLFLSSAAPSAGAASASGGSSSAGASSTAAGAAKTQSPSAAAGLPAGVASWAAPAIIWAEQEGVVQHPASLKPTAPAPRAQVVAWVVRALHLTATATSGTVPAFGDAARIPASYVNEVAVAQADGLVVGGIHGNFHPLASITRAEVAVLLVRAERALALEQGGATAPFTWQEQTSGSQGVPVASGSAQTGATTLPGGLVAAGLLNADSGSLQESFAATSRVGAGAVTLPLNGQNVRVPFAWEQEATGPGTIWLFEPGQSTVVSRYTESNGTVQVSGTAAPGFSAAAAIQVKAGSGGQESASACLGACAAGVTSVTYSGPQVPAAVLDVGLDAAFALILFPSGGGA